MMMMMLRLPRPAQDKLLRGAVSLSVISSARHGAGRCPCLSARAALWRSHFVSTSAATSSCRPPSAEKALASPSCIVSLFPYRRANLSSDRAHARRSRRIRRWNQRRCTRCRRLRRRRGLDVARRPGAWRSKRRETLIGGNWCALLEARRCIGSRARGLGAQEPRRTALRLCRGCPGRSAWGRRLRNTGHQRIQRFQVLAQQREFLSSGSVPGEPIVDDLLVSVLELSEFPLEAIAGTRPEDV